MAILAPSKQNTTNKMRVKNRFSMALRRTAEHGNLGCCCRHKNLKWTRNKKIEKNLPRFGGLYSWSILDNIFFNFCRFLSIFFDFVSWVTPYCNSKLPACRFCLPLRKDHFIILGNQQVHRIHWRFQDVEKHCSKTYGLL
mgnify:CR=1 FL=1